MADDEKTVSAETTERITLRVEGLTDAECEAFQTGMLMGRREAGRDFALVISGMLLMLIMMAIANKYGEL